jgi:hypothetical protein
MKTSSDLINCLNIELKKRHYLTYCKTTKEQYGQLGGKEYPQIKVRKLITPLFIWCDEDQIVVTDRTPPYRNKLATISMSDPKSIDYILGCVKDFKHATKYLTKKYKHVYLHG